MKNRATSSEIIKQADQVIAEERLLSNCDLVFAYSYGYHLLKSHLERQIAEETQEKAADSEPEEIIKLIGQYGKDCTDSGRKGYVTDELVVSTMSLVQYIYRLTNGTKSLTLPSQENENPTKS